MKRARDSNALKITSLATAVKLQDLTHNIDLSRIPYTTKKDNKSIKQYQRESAYLRKLKTVPSINLLKIGLSCPKGISHQKYTKANTT